jgi:DNA-binding MarR family transcriptional regulator
VDTDPNALSPTAASKSKVSLLTIAGRFPAAKRVAPGASMAGWGGGTESAPGRARRGQRGARATMHIVFFGLKRAHHGALRVTRRRLAELGLTAARFDLLYAVLERLGPPQVDLCNALGVSAPTVSRMVNSLQELGLVERQTAPEDRRLRLVVLTEAGRRCIEGAIARFRGAGLAQRLVDRALQVKRRGKDVCTRLEEQLVTTLDEIRRAYRDVANLYRPWEPDADDNPLWDQDPLLRGT